MAGRWSRLYEEEFTSTAGIEVIHNLGLEYVNIRVLVGGQPRTDLIEEVLVDEDDPTNVLYVTLASSQSGCVQILDPDTFPVGIAPNTRQYQAFTYGQHYTYAESLGQTDNATDAFLQKLRLTTPSVEAGNYQISWSFTFGHSQTSRSNNVQIEQDDTTILWDANIEPKDSSNWYPAAGFAQVTLSGVHTFDLDFRNGGGGTASVVYARMNLIRVT